MMAVAVGWYAFRCLVAAWAVYAVWHNLSKRKYFNAAMFALLFMGLVPNMIVMGANSLRMPVEGYKGSIADVYDGQHFVADAHTRLLWLADVHGWAKVRYSLGDVVLLGMWVIGWSKALFNAVFVVNSKRKEDSKCSKDSLH